MNRSAFTLIELLVVLAVISILSIVVVLTLNPQQLLAQSRDSTRVSDMATLTSALGDYLAEGATSLGSSNVVYVSIPDPLATSTAGDQCQGLGLLILPAGYTYQCANAFNYRNINGTGWIPVNFSSLATGSPLGQLPVDPANTSSSREYYTYTTNGTNYEVTAVPESQKYQLGGSNDVISGDGGTLASVYEKGSKLGLEPLDYGDPTLEGLWTFDEGAGAVAYDYSGNNATGTWSGTAGYSAGKVGNYAGNFNGSSNVYISTITPDGTGAWTIAGWFNTTVAENGSGGFWGIDGNHTLYGGAALDWNGVGIGSFSLNNNQWMNLVLTRSGNSFLTYENGTLTGSGTSSNTIPSGHFYVGAQNGGYDFTGLIDDVRIYNRALSATQIAAMYSGGK